jgi:hypothetical protein
MSWVITGREAGSLGLLDQYAGAAAAYSLRSLTLYYTGPVVRVRRSSDNTEQDFTAAQVTDGTLITFCGAGNGFVRTWYDQSGNGRNATQTTTANQPQIVSSGALLTEGTKPALSFAGSPVVLTLASSIFTAQPFTAFSVYKATANSSPVFGGTSNGATLARRVTSGEYIMFAGTALATGVHPSTRQLATGLFNGASSFGWWQSSQVLSGNTGSNTVVDLIGGNSTERLIGNIQEIIFYPSNESSNRVAIEASINAHYSIF